MEVCLQNNKVCIYSSDDWNKLRKDYRIVSEYLGTSTFTPALPVSLLPEEALFLLKRRLVKLVVYPKLQEIPTLSDSNVHDKLHNNLLQIEQTLYKRQRKDDLEKMADKIIEGKRRKINDFNLSREQVLEEELNKSCEITNETMIWPILNKPIESLQAVSVETTEKIENQTTPLKCAVFADLWEKGYYVTSGIKFGGDFLVYLGDPMAFHAAYVIRCVEDPVQEMQTAEIVAFGRLGASVKKRAVFASSSSTGAISYVTINWLDS